MADGGPGVDTLDEAGLLVAVLIEGVLTPAMTKEPNPLWGEGRDMALFPRLMKFFPVLYPPV